MEKIGIPPEGWKPYLEDGARPTYVNSIAIGKDGTVYTLGRVKRGGKVVGDLIKIPMRRGGRAG